MIKPTSSASPSLSASVPRPSPFEEMAADYDRSFTHTPLGLLLREAVWRRMDARFAAQDHILELNCGTGEDAIHLAQRGVRVLATDVAEAMVRTAHEKAQRLDLLDRISVQPLSIEHLADFVATRRTQAGSEEPMRFDGVLSNFGGLNCVSDWRSVATALAACVRPGGTALLCVMGPTCAWEWGWYLFQGRAKRAFRRQAKQGTEWRGLTIRYPSIRKMQQAFAPEFRPVRVTAIGALIPPTYAESWANRHPHLLARLNAWERRRETSPLLTHLADHYLLELERNS